MSQRQTMIKDIPLGEGHPLVLIAGPCVIESRELSMRIAESLHATCARLDVPFIFKASFDKANRTSLDSYRGIGIDQGLKVLEEIQREFSISVTTDFHEPNQAAAVAEVCDLLQVPAFLARQTDLLVEAAKTGKAVNVKKGQFMAPEDMQHVVTKLQRSGCQNILLTERGTFFGYGRLVNDLQSIPIMQSLGCPVVFDATHSVQRPGGLGATTGGNREMVDPLARAAVAIGTDALFLETHPVPDESPSDGANMLALGDVESMLGRLIAIREVAQSNTIA